MRHITTTLLFAAAAAVPPVQGQSTVGIASLPLSDSAMTIAVARGKQHRSRENYIKEGAKATTVVFAGFMATDGIEKTARLFSDFDVVAAAAAAAEHNMRPFSIEDAKGVTQTGLVFANLQMIARGTIPTSRLQSDWNPENIHMVLVVEDSVIQPLSKSEATRGERAGPPVLVGALFGNGSLLTGGVLQYRSGRLEQEFAFDVPESMRSKKAKVILIKPDGKRTEKEVDLAQLWVR